VSDPPLIPAAVYGLRTWRWAADDRGEYLIGAYQKTRWPDGGAWLHAVCPERAEHAAPEPDCHCGIHGWHPNRSSARRVLASRFDLPGILEAAGPIEVHEDGFRAQRGRPYAFFVKPGRNRRLAERLGERYRAQVVEVADADGLLAWCRDQGLGLDEGVVEQILGPDEAAQRRQARRRSGRRAVLRVVALVALAATVLVLGAVFATGPPSSRGVYGRTGWVIRPKPTARSRVVDPAPRSRPVSSSAARETKLRRRSTCGYGGRRAPAARGRQRENKRAAGERCRQGRRAP
jgi:hypothetical protein